MNENFYDQLGTSELYLQSNAIEMQKIEVNEETMPNSQKNGQQKEKIKKTNLKFWLSLAISFICISILLAYCIYRHFGGKTHTIKLNVGGTYFETLKSTITGRSGQNIFESNETKYDQNGNIFFDRDPQLFVHILNYLRDQLKFELHINTFNIYDKDLFFEELKFYKIAGHSIALQSTILTADQAKDLIYLTELSLLDKWKLIYRATQDGFLASDFHSKCNGYPNTLTIIKSSDGNVFGGFTTQAWDNNSGYKADSEAFLFCLLNKLNRPTKIKISQDSFQKAIYNNRSYGPTFGKDLFVLDESNTISKSYSALGQIYGNTYSELSYRFNKLFAESDYFDVSEIEVYFKIN